MTSPARRSSSASQDESQSWFEIPAQHVGEEGVILIREPSSTRASTVLRRFLDNRYAKPFVIDDGETRRLHFDLRFVQSQMSLADPDELVLAYTQKMAAFLLFSPQPRHVIIAGLGGGSLTKFCYRQLPRARITTLEVDRDVIALGDLFKIPASDARLRILHADAVRYLRQGTEKADVILLDGCDDSGVAAPFCKPALYRSIRERLRAQGVLVINLIGAPERAASIQTIVEDEFADACLTLTVKGGNRILFAFQDARLLDDWPAIRQRAEDWQSRTGLPFSALARQLKRGHGTRTRE